MASWSRLNYPRRLFLWLLAYSLLLVGSSVAYQYHREKEFKSEELNIRLQGINAKILSGMERGDTLPPVSETFPGLRVSIISPDGKVVYDNSLDPNLTANHLNRQEIASARLNGEGYIVRRHSESTGETYFYSATKGADGYIVRTAVPYSVSLIGMLNADMGFIWIMGGITAVMCLLGYFATRRLGLHILRLNRFAEMAERGETIYDCAPFPNDELGSISNHIVKLYAGLQQAICDRDREHKKALYAQREKERIKKQLTNNINHEIKTPIASIQACVELLLSHEEMDAAKRRDFLNRCMSNAERLKHLLADVAQITRMDDAPETIKKEALDLAEVIADAAADCEAMAGNRGMRIICDMAAPIPFFGNRTMLTSIFHNLLDNAIAYSGGTEVKLRLMMHTCDKVIISLCDNGSGVPHEHLPRIFERFYRIDKGRSRAAGGTGLGLAIVKNAVLLHNGSITADNLVRGGLAFTITFDLGAHCNHDEKNQSVV